MSRLAGRSGPCGRLRLAAAPEVWWPGWPHTLLPRWREASWPSQQPPEDRPPPHNRWWGAPGGGSHYPAADAGLTAPGHMMAGKTTAPRKLSQQQYGGRTLLTLDSDPKMGGGEDSMD